MDTGWVDLLWLPLGAGGHVVRWNGRVYEAVAARRERRARRDLFHSALQVQVHGTTYAVEMGPVWNVAAPERGVVCEGPVGARALGRFRAFRYEVRCWPGGSIPDLEDAVGEPQRLSQEAGRAHAVLEALRDCPPLTWGRDELGVGDMWNSNSVVAWALARSGHAPEAVTLPANGRAPGWDAGVRLARRGAAATV